MPWCPKCKTEYRPGYDTCADCHVPLVDELPAEPEKLDMPMPPPLDLGEPVLLTTVANTLDADILLAMLTDQGIPAYKKGRGMGAYSSIYMGASFWGVDIYVPQLLLEEARETMLFWSPTEDVKVELDLEDEQIDEPTGRSFAVSPILRWLIYILVALFTVYLCGLDGIFKNW